MNRLMEIQGYTAVVTYDSEIGLYRGEFLGLRGGAEFYAPSREALPLEGERSLEVFLKMCARDGAEPRRSFSGRIELDVSPDLHERLACLAEASGEPLAEWLRALLKQTVQRQSDEVSHGGRNVDRFF